jgi:hypothetical protein
MDSASAITFDTAEHEYNQAWNATHSTRFELAPVDVNTVLKKRYRVSCVYRKPKSEHSDDEARRRRA